MPFPSGLRCHTKGVARKSHSTKSNTALHQILEPDTGAACLPGGTPEPEDHADPETTLIREAREEAAAELAGIRYLGYLSDPGEPCARALRRRPDEPRPGPRRSGDRSYLRPDPGHPGAGRRVFRLGATRGRAAAGGPGPEFVFSGEALSKRTRVVCR
ncbi:NUDIX domain-containing protein [Streptomyces tanashiensis]|uniref:NUDIX domain-containing protein n=1 Tax=Streptomyces tanashiensis TaxID=67367 RepID=UPI001E4BA5AD|nr:NUDIX domain-containing protein [Streptomyces tanashiensis]